MLSSLFIGHTAEAIVQALTSKGAHRGLVAVLGQPRLARVLRDQGVPVLVVAETRKALRRVKHDCVCCRLDALPIAPGALSGLVAFEIDHGVGWDARIADWSAAVRARGAIVLVDRISPAELTRRALCGGLMDIEQRQNGRTFITSGVVEPLPRA